MEELFFFLFCPTGTAIQYNTKKINSKSLDSWLYWRSFDCLCSFVLVSTASYIVELFSYYLIYLPPAGVFIKINIFSSVPYICACMTSQTTHFMGEKIIFCLVISANYIQIHPSHKCLKSGVLFAIRRIFFITHFPFN